MFNSFMHHHPPHLLALGKRIRDVRSKLGISQEELADRCSLHRTYIGGVERGERNISFESLLKISEALQIDCGELVRGIKYDE
ncbi:MAG: helix-turn-helix domain-containing protein [Desulfobaccales bacterium]